MVKTSTLHNGQTYSLCQNVIKGNDFDTINKLDIQYREQADRMAKEKKCHVFYNLKKFSNTVRGYEYSQYFLVPIDDYDVEEIPLKFNAKSCDYSFGISYYHSIPTITYEERMAIRHSYWDKVSGYEYEEQCADELRRMGFNSVEVTTKSGDQGIDVIAWKDGLKYGIQCKHYQGSVPNKAVQEAHTGAAYYDCDVAVVMTNSTFTESAKDLAHKIGVKLWSSSETYREV